MSWARRLFSSPSPPPPPPPPTLYIPPGSPPPSPPPSPPSDDMVVDAVSEQQETTGPVVALSVIVAADSAQDTPLRRKVRLRMRSESGEADTCTWLHVEDTDCQVLRGQVQQLEKRVKQEGSRADKAEDAKDKASCERDLAREELGAARNHQISDRVNYKELADQLYRQKNNEVRSRVSVCKVNAELRKEVAGLAAGTDALMKQIVTLTGEVERLREVERRAAVRGENRAEEAVKWQSLQAEAAAAGKSVAATGSGG